MKRVLLSCAFAVGIALTGASARAQWAVLDASNLVQTTETAISTAKTVDNMIQQVNLMKQTLETLDPSSFSSLRSLLARGQITYAALSQDISALGFALSDVNSRFDTVFPKDKAAWSGAHYADYDNYYAGWNAEITGSAKLAARAQSAVLTVESNNQTVADILSQSNAANGEIRQLQLINQQLALIHARLGDLVQNIATLGRITANMAASSASEKLLLREAKLRRRDNYTDRGHPAQILTRLP